MTYILKVYVGQLIERPMGVRKVVGSNFLTGQEFFFLINISL